MAKYNDVDTSDVDDVQGDCIAITNNYPLMTKQSANHDEQVWNKFWHTFAQIRQGLEFAFDHLDIVRMKGDVNSWNE